MVEHAAVNRVVVGSSPTSGAILKSLDFKGFSPKSRLASEPVSADLSAKNDFPR